MARRNYYHCIGTHILSNGQILHAYWDAVIIGEDLINPEEWDEGPKVYYLDDEKVSGALPDFITSEDLDAVERNPKLERQRNSYD